MLSDPIFQLDRATKVDYPNEIQCIVCDKEFSKKSHKHGCQFCGHKACERCAYKLRVFANQNLVKVGDITNLALSDIQKKCRMGRVCRICDRKFFLRASFQQYAGQLQYYVSETVVVEKELEELQEEIDEIADQQVEINAMIDEEE